MKRLLEEAQPSLGSLAALVASAQRYEPNPFAKRLMQSRLAHALETRSPRRFLALQPAWLGLGALLVAASAAAAGYSILRAPAEPAEVPKVLPPATRGQASSAARVVRPSPHLEVEALPTASEKPAEPRVDKRRAGEDPSQVAEAVRALRKQGDPASAQRLLDQYLRANPRGALAEDALALSIEAAAARKDPRAADYARRYLARYPKGRFRGMAERALSH